MKVIFLDIDGVINSQRTCTAFGGYPSDFFGEDAKRFDQVAIALIRKLCLITGACVVMSSSWRRMFSLESFAIVLGMTVIDRTPHTFSAMRGEEIAMWLRNHPEVTNYCIIDDESDMLSDQENNFVKVSPENGFSWENYMSALHILNK